MRIESAVLFFALGGALIAQTPQPKMGAPLAGLTAAELQKFDAGKVDFTHTFQAPEGLGPTFNQASCGSCHNNPVGGPGSQAVFRFGFYDAKGVGWDPLASLGGSLLQANTIHIACQEVIPASANVQSARITTSSLGIGLIEAIVDADISVRETTPPSPNVSGRARMVVPLETPLGPPRVGRFGWKAQVATVLTFSGDAALNELGFTNRLVPTENAPNGNVPLMQAHDAVADPEDGPDAQGQHFIDRVTDFQRFLAGPPQTPRSGMSGEAIFNSVGCVHCHVASFTTSNNPLLETAIRNKVIKPYSDFLLHDMGNAADFIGDGTADIQELRTPPLWGVRSRDPLWHDGRVTGGTFEQRILGPGNIVALHAVFGSEAQTSALALQALPAADQLKVVAFLDSLGRAEFDSNGDNVRNHLDLAAFLLAQGGGPYTADSPQAVFDFDQDGDVDNADLQAFRLVYEEDCNGNGTNDLEDVLSGAAPDSNGNLIPDSCEVCQQNVGLLGPGTAELWVCGGDLSLGNEATLAIEGTPASAPVLLIAGFSNLSQPWNGGLLIDTAPPLVIPLVANVAGNIYLTNTPPSGIGSFVLFAQAVYVDGGQAFGFGITNALQIQLQP